VPPPANQIINNPNPAAEPQTNVTAATVTIGEVPIEDQNAKVVENSDGVDVEYLVRSRYEFDGRRHMLGISSPGGFLNKSVAFVQLSAPTLLWLASWTAARIGRPPDVPDPVSQDPNWVLLDVIPEVPQMVLARDGVSAWYRISATYVYGHQAPGSNVFALMQFPKPPWIDGSVPRVIPADAIKPDILMGAGGGQQAAPGVPPNPNPVGGGGDFWTPW